METANRIGKVRMPNIEVKGMIISVPARSRLTLIMIGRRLRESTQVPAKMPTTMRGKLALAASNPISNGEAPSVTAAIIGSAIRPSWPPKLAMVSPIQKRRKS